MEEGTMRTNKEFRLNGHLGRMPDVSWKSALGLVLGPASRLHHYRDVHTHTMRVAMCEVDCGAERDKCDDE
jgi:hypothetical protein